jgi:hypothetical protein
MAFKMKEKSSLFGIDQKTSTCDTPVFNKKLEPGIGAEANRDGTIFVEEGLDDSEKEEAVEHETLHLKQLKQGKLAYTNDTVTWKKDTRSPARVYKREMMAEGAKNLPWEKEVYDKTKK